jgi:perosamine synthetase
MDPSPAIDPSLALAEIQRFGIGFDPRDRPRLHALWDEVIDSGQWTEGRMVGAFEAAWEAWNGLPALAVSGWSGGAMAALEYAGVRGETVLCPSNTFPAVVMTILKAGGRPVFVDCGRDDLCVSLEDFAAKLEAHRPKAAWLVHIGGHIAFEVERIADLCSAHDVFLIEDCAHAHGASWNGRRAGTWGDAGVWSLYATKTVSTGEGGVLVSRDPALLAFVRGYRNYGKPDFVVEGLNYRMSEFTAALGLVQVERMEEIVRWKNAAAHAFLDPLHQARLELPQGMVSGLYKYIVFDPVEPSSGKVYDRPCHRIWNTGDDLPNSDWVAEHHWCVPLYYRPEAASLEALGACA